ncbi:UNVERIFIED_ORG: hypothetical protein ABIB19_003225 [Arthrobacter sp. UYEF10]
MSMSYRAISSALNHLPAVTWGTATLARTQDTEALRDQHPGITCSPWEGLYLSQAHLPTSGELNSAVAASNDLELERFLSVLMFGE